MHEGGRRFPPWIQLACVAGYFGTDLFLRFAYQAVLGGGNSSSVAVQTEYGDEAYVVQRYDKPTFIVLLGYVNFFLWGPILVWPYLLLRKKVSVVEYYKTAWSGELSFEEAFKYTCWMGVILFLGNLGYVAGLMYINVAFASALSQGEAPFTVALSAIFLHRVFGKYEKIGIVLSFAGIALISIPPVLRAQSLAAGEQDSNAASAVIGGILSTLFGA
jgi:drug/metabolite transporter (DMT)-like permease